MIKEFNLTDLDTNFEEKVYAIADEVLNILKELSQENKNQINSKAIAEKMFWKDSVKNILSVNNNPATEQNVLKNLSNSLLDKLTELMPSSLTLELGNLKKRLHTDEIIGGSQAWLESPVQIIKKYIDSLTVQNRELKDFMQQTIEHLAETEGHVANELSLQKTKFKDDKNFEVNIFNNLDNIKQECSIHGDLGGIKLAVISKIDSINKEFERKKLQDIQRYKETEKNLEEMNKRMLEIKRDADDIRRKSQEIEFESFHDSLTGLYNRRAYDEKIIETIACLERYNVPASFIICDIDHFKKINDTLGHKVGDLALKKLGSLLKQRLRINDFVSRYGGEEFAIILPHTDLEGAIKAAEGIRSFIDKSNFSYKNQQIPLTISAGVSAFRIKESGSAVFERADNALYLAKKSGRNQVRNENDIANEPPADSTSQLKS